MLIAKDFLKTYGYKNPHFFHLIFSPNHPPFTTLSAHQKSGPAGQWKTLLTR